ncbi:MAG: YbjN domain-containing protein, partial [Pseudomonadota bacterium]
SRNRSAQSAQVFAAILAGTVLSAVASTSAFAESKLVDARNPDRLLEIARGYGTANLDVAADDTPMIIGRIDGTRYNIFFYDCDGENENCKSIQFYAGWTDIDMSLRDMNEWNKTKRWFQAYQDDEGDSVIEMDVNMFGGVSFSNADDTFDWWRIGLKEFLEYAKEAGDN